MPNLKPGKKPRIGISSCLLGQPVRYDGTDKRDDFICRTLSNQFELNPLCPEVSAGLGAPRPPVKLVGDIKHPQALGVEDATLNVTEALETFSHAWLHQPETISGYILKSRSPSCGLWDTPIFDGASDIQTKGAGIFARILTEHDPLLPVEDETGINNPARRKNFITRVECYNAWQHLCIKGITTERLAAFHQQQIAPLTSLTQRDSCKFEQLFQQANEDSIREIAMSYIGQVMPALKKLLDREKRCF